MCYWIVLQFRFEDSEKRAIVMAMFLKFFLNKPNGDVLECFMQSGSPARDVLAATLTSGLSEFKL